MMEDPIRIFRQTGNPRYLPAVVRLILGRHVAEDVQPRLVRERENADLRLVEDLGIDSLTLMEIALATEDAVGVPVDFAELRRLITVGELERMLAVKTRGAAAATR